MSRVTRLVSVLVRTGRLEEAQQLVDGCLDVLAQGEDWGGIVGRIAFARGHVLSAQGKWSDADAAFDEALAVARRYGLPWDEAEVLHERARMHLTRGEKVDRRQALRLLDETVAIYQRLGAKKHLEFVVADKMRAQGIDPSMDFQTSIDAVAAGVQREHTDLRQHAAPDGTVTILFSDIEGSTTMTERLGDQRWLQVLREHNRIVREHLAAHGGYEVKSQGDGFMLAFQSARRALHCAVAIQRAFAAHNRQHADGGGWTYLFGCSGWKRNSSGCDRRTAVANLAENLLQIPETYHRSGGFASAVARLANSGKAQLRMMWRIRYGTAPITWSVVPTLVRL